MLRAARASARLVRLGMAPLTMSVPVLGALSNDKILTLRESVILLLIGLCAHTFGFGLNDIVDRPVDRMSPVRRHHPLETGELKLWQALVIVTVSIPAALILSSQVFSRDLQPLFLLSTSIVLSVLYNLGSKRGILPRFVAEVALASSVGILCLVGASFKATLSVESYLYALTLTLILLMLNSVPSGLKDIHTDLAAGAQSFVIVSGCNVDDSCNVFIPTGIKLYSVILQGLIAAGLAGLGYLYQISLFSVIIVLMFYTYGSLHLRMLLSMKSLKHLVTAKPLLNGFFNYLTLSLILFSIMPVLMKALYILLSIYLLTYPLGAGLRVWKARFKPL